jgi:Ca2+-binding EF-hand superfamily protein
MADEKKVKKKKKAAAEAAPAEAAPEPEAAPPPPPPKEKKRSTKKATRTGSNVGGVFSDKQVAEFKDGHNFMDIDKDGIIGKNDLRSVYDAMGKICSDKELDEMLGESAGPLTISALLSLFGNRMAGSADDDEVIVGAFKMFDDNGKINSETLRHQLMTFGDKFSAAEVDDAFDQMTIDNAGRIDTAKLIGLFTASAQEEEEEEE